MASISFKGFVQKHEGNRPWEVAEGHSKKEGEKWVTLSKTYHKVWLPDTAPSLDEGDLVEVTGRQITPPKKGDYKPTPIVYADTVTIIKAANTSSPAAPSATDAWNTPGSLNDQTPF